MRNKLSNSSSRSNRPCGSLREIQARPSFLGALVVCTAVIVSSCATVAPDNEIVTTPQSEAGSVCPVTQTEQLSCEQWTTAYHDGFRAGQEIVRAEFRTRSELNQPYVWQPPMISEVDMPARIVNGMMIPAHRELVIVGPGYWVRTESLISPAP